MKTTIDIPDNILTEVLEYSGERTKRQAIITAIEEFIRIRKMHNLASELGTFENFMTQKELREMRES